MASIWEYKDIAPELAANTIGTENCIYCSTILIRLGTKSGLVDWEGKTAPYWGEGMTFSQEVHSCPGCGWWTMLKYFVPQTKEFAINGGGAIGTAGMVGSLKEFDVTSEVAPIQEVRDFLAANYEKRFRIHPRVFEETVASVFSGIGYVVRVTGYSKDDGIDVILEDSEGKQIGVQVKRYSRSIKVEQIRSLAGALMIGGYTKGVFVTTSSFQRGAERTSKLASNAGYKIELMDSEAFYRELLIGQRTTIRTVDEWEELVNVKLVDAGLR